MYAIVARENDYDEGYWDFWTYNNQQEAIDDISAFPQDEVKIVNLEDSCPESDFVNSKLQER